MPNIETDDALMPLRIVATREEASGIRSFELAREDDGELPPFTPGSHVKVRVPNGELRKYSLCDSPERANRYVITVKREANGRGGSISLVDQAREGDILPTSAPDNAFPLVDNPGNLIFIAGGIGITPMLSMIRSFGELPPCSWKLYYLSQSAATTAYLDVLADPAVKANVKVHHDEGDPGKSFDLWPVLEKPNRGHVYCCGPRGLMDAVRDMSGHWSPGRVHFESFVDGSVPRADDQPFDIELVRTGKTLTVPVGKTILSVLREADVRVPSSCESGTCGSCRTTLLEGQADHRDMVLMEEEHASQIMVCVSRGCGKLVLDL
jgi:phthalate 4,5-dioxygenase reductase subunit